MRHRYAVHGRTPTADDLVREGRIPEAITVLLREARTTREPAAMSRLIRLRRFALADVHRAPRPRPDLGPPVDLPLDPKTRLAVVTPAELSAQAIHSGIETSGALLVRGLMNAETIGRLRAVIDRAFEARARYESGVRDAETRASYEELENVPWGGGRTITAGSGVLAADSPLGFFEMFEAFDAANLLPMVEGFLGERPVVTVEKTVLRRVPPASYASWHQDGRFLGTDIRALNLWVALNRCGETAPSLEILPRRVDHLLHSGAYFEWDIDDSTVEELHPGAAVLARFEPGDALFFDHLFVHRTGVLPSMNETRYALESWFFAPSAYPVADNSTGLYV